MRQRSRSSVRPRSISSSLREAAGCSWSATCRCSRCFRFGAHCTTTEHGRVAWNFFFQNPNDLAMACFLPMGLCAYLIYLERDNRWVRLAAWAGLIVLMGVQLLTQSRGAILAFAAGVLYVILHSRQRLRLALGIGMLLFVAALLTPSGVWQRVSGLSSLVRGNVAQADAEGSAAGRATLMHLAFTMASDNPLLGVGFGAYGLENARVTASNLSIGRDERGQRDAHSSYLRAAAETGWLGALSVAMFITGAVMFCRRTRKQLAEAGRDQQQVMAVLALEASMLAFAAGAIVNSAERSTFFMLQFVIPWLLAASHTRGGKTTKLTHGQAEMSVRQPRKGVGRIRSAGSNRS
jgi:O-antigen ligase